VNAGNSGVLDWGCSAGGAAATASARGIVVANFGTVLAKYAPAQCR
jgi:type IV pilus assembly protein PilA